MYIGKGNCEAKNLLHYWSDIQHMYFVYIFDAFLVVGISTQFLECLKFLNIIFKNFNIKCFNGKILIL